MSRLWRILILVPLGFVLACWAAAAVLFFSVPPALQPGETVLDYLAKAGLISFVAAFVVGAVAGIPALLMILFAESFGWRSLLLHLLFGAGLGAAAILLGIAAEPPASAREVTVFAAAGAVGGFVYWLLAGRRAGR
ncbi:hypothetical protein [Afifella pfennigii]|uniref:hypothetical protein n=1 Tax=Afifella pfennigii TaxID=209897 RepID=UPI00055813B0|nr:hypothetical protein [Afifella pfennigii]